MGNDSAAKPSFFAQSPAYQCGVGLTHILDAYLTHMQPDACSWQVSRTKIEGRSDTR
ncbi:hypothetical protein IEO21_01475 [Rhodonia placenta]|uniref:Uncharacterized protein n=2 Tax=Rhodonia placenta TaxID=104341 RepID=A0A1X6NCS0_9APHY|nr:hypothetical protein POSPLADRAFT_1038569 [Postia placenta MAD-698-R-SB12]KAF9820261.1 hypothetical protein IEO21_01475 [Postia placenta]OSX66292.1 hypothetical protein POSPLADRAFT_1038569 [Postia placenta MAD-698-R-SB12]